MSDPIIQSLQKAHSARLDGDIENAVTFYSEVLRLQPNNPEANHHMGVIEVNNLRAKKALKYFELSLRSNPGVHQFWAVYIDCLLRLDRISEARAVLQKVKESEIESVAFNQLNTRLYSPLESLEKGFIYKAEDGMYLDLLAALHNKRYENYFEIGSETGASLCLSNSPSIAIDPYFQLSKDPIGQKDFCLLFQEKSSVFFERTLEQFPGLACEFAFIDGMHLFEYPLCDFINLVKIATEKSFILFHDVLPWDYKMATRNYAQIPKGDAWTGDVWKLIPILYEEGFSKALQLITAGPSGLLAVVNPNREKIAQLEARLPDIIRQWREVTLEEYGFERLYQYDLFVKPEAFFHDFVKEGIGSTLGDNKKVWVSH